MKREEGHDRRGHCSREMRESVFTVVGGAHCWGRDGRDVRHTTITPRQQAWLPGYRPPASSKSPWECKQEGGEWRSGVVSS